FITQESIAYFVPRINRWQTFSLTEEKDGINGTIQICLMSEEGKININRIYDFEKKKFIGEGNKQEDWKILLQEIFNQIEKQANTKGLFEAFTAFLKKQDGPLDDVTQLLQNSTTQGT